MTLSDKVEKRRSLIVGASEDEAATYRDQVPDGDIASVSGPAYGCLEGGRYGDVYVTPSAEATNDWWAKGRKSVFQVHRLTGYPTERVFYLEQK